MFNQLDRLSDYKDSEWAQRTKAKRNDYMRRNETRRRVHVKYAHESTDLYMEHEHFEDTKDE